MDKKQIGFIAGILLLVIAAFMAGRATAPEKNAAAEPITAAESTVAAIPETTAESTAAAAANVAATTQAAGSTAATETTAAVETTTAATTQAAGSTAAAEITAATTHAAETAAAETTAVEAQVSGTQQTGTQQTGTAPSPEAYRQLFLQCDPGDATVYVIGHKTPDSDTVTSAIAMAGLLNQLGIKAVPRITAKPNKETEFFLKECGVETPEILENAAGSVLWLVDHSEYSQAVDGAEEARILGITDHHGIGSVSTTELIVVNSAAYGSTSSAVFWTYVNCGAEITPQMAKVMLSGLISDTNNLKNSTALDKEAYEQLKNLAGLSQEAAEELNTARKVAKYDRTGMSDREVFYSDYKDYEKDGITYGVANISVYAAEEVPGTAAAMAEFAKKEIGETDKDFLVYTVQDSTYAVQYIGYAGADQAFTETLMEEAFGKAGEKKGTCYVLNPSVSRKKFVPYIDNAITSMLKN